MRRIESIDELISLCNKNTYSEFFIALFIGRSTKEIRLVNDETIIVNNLIDSTKQSFNINKLKAGEYDDVTNIKTAIEKGNFYAYEYGYKDS